MNIQSPYQKSLLCKLCPEPLLPAFYPKALLPVLPNDIWKRIVEVSSPSTGRLHTTDLALTCKQLFEHFSVFYEKSLFVVDEKNIQDLLCDAKKYNLAKSKYVYISREILLDYSYIAGQIMDKLKNVTVLTIGFLRCHEVLPICPKLEKLRIEVLGSDETILCSPQPSLRSMEIIEIEQYHTNTPSLFVSFIGDTYLNSHLDPLGELHSYVSLKHLFIGKGLQTLQRVGLILPNLKKLLLYVDDDATGKSDVSLSDDSVLDIRFLEGPALPSSTPTRVR